MQVTNISKRKYFTKEKKLQILKELQDSNLNLSDLARKHNIHPVTVHKWKREMNQEKEQGNIAVEELLLEIEALKEKNRHLKSALADLTIDNEILQTANDVLKKAQIKKQLQQQKK